MAVPTRTNSTNEALALIASNLLLMPANLSAGMTFTTALKQAHNLLLAAKRFLDERDAAIDKSGN